jgi:antitoxin HicB
LDKGVSDLCLGIAWQGSETISSEAGSTTPAFGRGMIMGKKKTHTVQYKYRIDIFWSSEDSCFVVNVPELEGCMTHGETLEEAVSNAQEAIDGFIESLKARGLPVPIPIADQAFSGKIPLRIDPNLHRDLVLKAQIEGKSLNKYIETRLRRSG